MSVTGPQFLLFYAVLAFTANLWLRRRYRLRESALPASQLEFAHDPYRIAWLRAGADDAVRVAVFSLIDRGLLRENDGQLSVASGDAASFARRPIERAVLACYGRSGEVDAALKDPGVMQACRDYEGELQRHCLLAGGEVFAARRPAFLAALLAVGGVAAARLLYALAHGRHNVLFLVVFALAAALALFMAYRRRRTGLGDLALQKLKALFAGLKRRAAGVRPGGADHDAVLLAALFGFALLPAAHFPYVGRLFPKPSSSDGGSGDSGGGSDGGGGCGGGCGGCG